MEKLVAALRVSLADTFVMYFKAQSYHWNVEGMFFPQYHSFFGGIYDDLSGAVDPLAENIRKLDAYSPVSLHEILAHSIVEEDKSKPSDVKEMLTNLLHANQTVSESLNETLKLATKSNQQGLMNFLADRIDIHAKHEWMIKSSLKAHNDNA